MILGHGQPLGPGATPASRSQAMFSRGFRARPAAVRETLIAMSDRLGPHISTDLMGRSELVLAELLNNVAQHGRAAYHDSEPLVHVSVVARAEGLACSVSDNGGLLPGACLSSEAPEPASFPEGGFGWFLIGHLTQSLVYFRENGRNFVAFTVPADPTATPKPNSPAD
ncbi:ATP-binding protein [Paracoccus sediminicola]|uniref:ATP-binding protein n=1 Tax=Paracoccus sediminicola TaxID=3017783 RepID=UPI0022F0F3F6|nr:ATP-binding protein [Paracoccus sediminicola]WBU57104.1 ATP-binding protein [Paracoccus sediminicola]